MARVRSGQAPAWPLSSDRNVRRGSRVKRDFACTFTRHFSPVLVVLRSRSRFRLERRIRTPSGPSPDLSPASTLAPSASCEDLLIRRFLCGHPDPFRSVRDLGLVSPGCTSGSGTSEGCSSVWLPAWLPARAAPQPLPAVSRAYVTPVRQRCYLGFQRPCPPCHPRSSRVYPARYQLLCITPPSEVGAAALLLTLLPGECCVPGCFWARLAGLCGPR